MGTPDSALVSLREVVMRHIQRVILSVALVLLCTTSLAAQVTTATLVGLVRDSQNAVIPGATVVATHEGTGVSREGVTDANGEFVFSALPSGPYSVRVELTGFKTLQQQGMQLGAGQTVRQSFALEVGTLTETVTVAGEAPLVDNSASVQADSIGAQEVTELPTNRRNLSGLMGLSTGVNTYGEGGGFVQMNGVAAGGTGVTVDGTEANSNPEARSLAQYGGQNQISVMSLDSVAEVQIVKGVLPAEYGGVAGGQINVISRSGTNVFHGSAFYAGQNEKWNARQFFSTAQQPVGTFNQYGGTLGGPVLRNRAFFFTTYEGYREKVERNLDVVVPYQAVRDEIIPRAAVSRNQDRPRCAADADRIGHHRRRRQSAGRPLARPRHPPAHREPHRGQGRHFDVQRREPRTYLYETASVHAGASAEPEQHQRSRIPQRAGPRRGTVGHDAGVRGCRKAASDGTRRISHGWTRSSA